ncbi:YbaB/EbfC family nucleoid-associated protein [Nocardiopsis sp. MT53]|uniref:YbaB/EbfC family nucleoid-associated protein n=1 Tax=Nocardiopsis changdeensis TaxID=2831969 RepID=A0ABX8BEZ2_9ACTN|nr:YbaB/EbfC family nucleoid-associated protein [Nocardiopsis changdeensis]QYX36742.1 YbaB/EbfC family nucleoid-associated protein [Nocardiopsis sp. MT53]
MSSSMREQMEAELERLHTTMRELSDASASLESATEEAVAKNRLVAATVDGTGRLTELKFHTEGYRTMAPAELSAAIVEVVGRAQKQMADRVAQAYEAFMPEGIDTQAAIRGDLDPEETLRRMGVSLDDLG